MTDEEVKLYGDTHPEARSICMDLLILRARSRNELVARRNAVWDEAFVQAQGAVEGGQAIQDEGAVQWADAVVAAWERMVKK